MQFNNPSATQARLAIFQFHKICFEVDFLTPETHLDASDSA